MSSNERLEGTVSYDFCTNQARKMVDHGFVENGLLEVEVTVLGDSTFEQKLKVDVSQL